MVKLENISFSYNKKQEFIKDLSLEFKSGEGYHYPWTKWKWKKYTFTYDIYLLKT